MRIRITGKKASPIVNGLGFKENDPAWNIHGASIEGHEAIPLYDSYTVKTGNEPLVTLPPGGAKCKVHINGHQIAKLTRGEPTRVYDMDPVDPNKHFACGDHYDALLTLDQLEHRFRNTIYYVSFIAKEMQTDNILFEKSEGE